MARTPKASLADQRISCGESTFQVSPPTGEITATSGGVRSTLRVAPGPGAASRVALSQSRSATSPSTTVPVPSWAVPATVMVKSVPARTVLPHGSPRITPSAL